MKINEVEALVGVTRKNIRYYEQEGLLNPPRNRANGYRDYGEDEVQTLRRIRLLRKLGVPLAEIRSMQEGQQTLSEALRRHAVTLNHTRHSAEQSMALCERIMESGQDLSGLDAEGWMTTMEQLEQEGSTFMNQEVKDVNRRFVGPLIAGLVMLALMVGVLAILLWAYTVDPIPLWVLALIIIPIGAVMVGTVLVLMQRYKEIKGGEEDAARKY